MDASITVAIGDVDFALGRQSGARAAVERLAAHILCRLPGHADLEQHLAVERAFAHKMPAIVSQIDRVIQSHMGAVRSWVLALPPRPKEIAVSVEDHDRMLAPAKGVDVVFRVYGDRGHFLERPALRQLRPGLDDAIPEVAGAYDV